MTAPMKATKTELISLLNSMNVPIQTGTKLNVAELENRLRESLDESQYLRSLSSLFPASTPPTASQASTKSKFIVNPSTLPQYIVAPGEKLLDNIKRHSLNEAFQNFQIDALGADPHARGKEQPFYDLRQTLMAIANFLDKGTDCVLVSDKNRKSLIAIRVAEARKAAEEKTPLLVVLFCHDQGMRSVEESKFFPWCAAAQDKFKLGGVPGVTADLMEQHLLLRLLVNNSQRLKPNALSESLRYETEKAFSFSFLLPVGPISMEATDEIAIEATKACAVCGVISTTYCGACRAIFYCSREHSKAHWKTHKSVCKSIKGATWLTVPIPTPDDNKTSQMSEVVLNWASLAQSTPDAFSKSVKHVGSAQPNTHGSQPFIVKLQLDIISRSSILVYDQSRSLQLRILKSTCNPGVWSKLMDAFRTDGVRGGIKLYVWTRRTDEWEISVSVDRLPLQESFLW